MPIHVSTLESAAARARPQPLAKSLTEALAKSDQTAFLCHSHLDSGLAKGLQILLAEHGWNIYLDWQDTAMPATPNRVTANKIKTKIKSHDWFLFLATRNSVTSRWCPWEIGFADSAKQLERILVVDTEDSTGWHGNEYLGLYRSISSTSTGKLALFEAGSSNDGILVSKLHA